MCYQSALINHHIKWLLSAHNAETTDKRIDKYKIMNRSYCLINEPCNLASPKHFLRFCKTLWPLKWYNYSTMVGYRFLLLSCIIGKSTTLGLFLQVYLDKFALAPQKGRLPLHTIQIVESWELRHSWS